MFILLDSARNIDGRGKYAHLADWWPAALVGLAALLGANPQGHAETRGAELRGSAQPIVTVGPSLHQDLPSLSRDAGT